MVAAAGLKLQLVLSFHSCGCNVGDSCVMPLPAWVESAGAANPDIFFADRSGERSHEYVTFAADHLPVLGGRTPLGCYEAFMGSFRSALAPWLGGVVTSVAVSLGPAGELRYPAYPGGRWRFPGVGEFQCYDRYRRGGGGGGGDWGDDGESCLRSLTRRARPPAAPRARSTQPAQPGGGCGRGGAA